MKATRIHVEPLHKSFDVKHTHKMVMRANKYRLLSLEATNHDADASDIETARKQLEMDAENVDFVVDMLNLDDKQREKLENLDEDKLGLVDIQVMLAVQGARPAEIKKAIAAAADAQKSAEERDEDPAGSGQDEKRNN